MSRRMVVWVVGGTRKVVGNVRPLLSWVMVSSS
jgi:hypothetical protein